MTSASPANLFHHSHAQHAGPVEFAHGIQAGARNVDVRCATQEDHGLADAITQHAHFIAVDAEGGLPPLVVRDTKTADMFAVTPAAGEKA